MKIGSHDIGVCSWSLRTDSASELVKACGEVGLSHVQLALGPLLGKSEEDRQKEVGILRDGGITIASGMIGFAGEDYSTIAMIRQTGGVLPDDRWADRLARAKSAGDLAKSIGVAVVSTHIGFIPRSSDARYPVVQQRTTEIARHYESLGLKLLMETGQESATELLQFLNDLPARNVGVNFDPGNMILYGAGDPVEAVRTLGRHVHQVHVKDARLSDQPGVKWGEEVPFGRGDVDVPAFLATLASVKYAGPLVIEREAGPNRVADIRTAVETLQKAATM